MIRLEFFKSKLLTKDIVIALLIVLMPLLFYVHLLFPEAETFDFLIFNFNSKYYEYVDTLVWIVMIKIVFMLSYSIWFVSCKHWWRFAILVPLIFSINQFLVVVNSELYYVDDNELFASLILTIPIIIILILLSKKLNYYNASKNVASDINEEIQNLWEELLQFNKQDYLDIVEELKQLRSQKEQYDIKTYLEKLIYLRDSLTSYKT